MGRVLVVDDEQLVLRMMERALLRKGYKVDACDSASGALKQLERRSYDVVISDIRMAEMDGIALLRAARSIDPDVPVILITGGPSVDTAVEAVEHGAFRYLIKPLRVAEMVDVVRRAERMHALIKLRRTALEVTGEDLTGLEAQLDSALDSMWVAFQPIVTAQEPRLFGYEALLRTEEPSLAAPRDFVAAAAKLGRGFELGQAIRRQVSIAASAAPDDAQLFINLDVDDLSDDLLYDAAAPLSALAHRVVLEITEHASLEPVPGVRGRVDRLRQMGFRIALDDMGAGYAGLTNLALLEPEIVKLDMSLVRGVQHDGVKRRVIGSMVELSDDLSISVLAEGVETVGERLALTELGCELMQGFLFARPQRVFCEPRFD